MLHRQLHSLLLSHGTARAPAHWKACRLLALAGMARHESTLVVTTYYITMTLFASVQGLCVFHLMPQLTPLSATGFTFGMFLSIGGVLWMFGMRTKQGRASSAPRAHIGSPNVTNVDRNSLIESHAAHHAETATSALAAEVAEPGGAAAPNVRLELPAHLPSGSQAPPTQRHTVS